jgi:flagellar motor protein MotB
MSRPRLFLNFHLLFVPVFLPIWGCATSPPVHAVSDVQCPPSPPPIYAKNCVLKKDVLDVADQMLTENESAESKLTALQRSVVALEEEVARALQASLETVVSGQASVAIVGGRVRVRLSDELLFPSASVQISANGLHALTQVTDVLRHTPSRRIEIAGHTDDRPVLRGWQDNWQLSAERARQVGLFLTAHGIEGKRIFIAGYADTDPADGGGTDGARARNRRVDLFIEPTTPSESPQAPESSVRAGAPAPAPAP